MDAGLLNFHKEEGFSYFLESYEDSNMLCNDSSIDNYSSGWEWEQERELNGDIGLIASAAGVISTSPPMGDDFRRIISDWQNAIRLDTVSLSTSAVNSADDLAIDVTISTDPEKELLTPGGVDGFDLAQYITQPDNPHNRALKSDLVASPPKRYGGKQIRMQQTPHAAHKKWVDDNSDDDDFDDEEEEEDDGDEDYVEESADEDDEDNEDDISVDVEALSDTDNDSPPVLQATNVKNLLEQFEANETTNTAIRHKKIGNKTQPKKIDIVEPVSNFVEDSTGYLKPTPIEQILGNSPARRSPVKSVQAADFKGETVTAQITSPNAKKQASKEQSKQILDALPIELIDRIRQSGKRKPITVIPPIVPTKKRHNVVAVSQTDSLSRNEINANIIQPNKNNTTCPPTTQIARNYSRATNATTVVIEPANHADEAVTVSTNLDHNYCTIRIVPIETMRCDSTGRSAQKDSGFTSEEDDQRAILRNQPIVKAADGTRMVSLLKANTITTTTTQAVSTIINVSNVHNQPPTAKRKLNLAEYKKRLQTRSKTNSGHSSPLLGEDENTRRLRHQEMLMQMAYKVIEQQKNKYMTQNVVTSHARVNGEAVMTPVVVKVEPGTEAMVVKTPPSNIVKKTLVSTSANTEESWGHLEQILQNTKMELTPNSLISSIVEHLPRTLQPKREQQARKMSETEHGEDKTIVYIDKSIPKPSTRSVAVQTIRTIADTLQQHHHGARRRRYRTQKRNISSSRCNSRSSSSGGSSRSSSRSHSSGSSRSRGSTSNSSRSCSSSSSHVSSRSCSPSPVRRRHNIVNGEQYDLTRVVEERRVIYVGRIANGMTKDDLRRRFARFGPICNVSTHFRQEADNYGFVTFMQREHAFNAIEHGNDDPNDTHYDLSFGGRRQFCQQRYADLDRMEDHEVYMDSMQPLGVANGCGVGGGSGVDIGAPAAAVDNSFDALLRRAQAQLRLRKV